MVSERKSIVNWSQKKNWISAKNRRKYSWHDRGKNSKFHQMVAEKNRSYLGAIWLKNSRFGAEMRSINILAQLVVHLFYHWLSTIAEKRGIIQIIVSKGPITKITSFKKKKVCNIVLWFLQNDVTLKGLSYDKIGYFISV